jgi:hypothetical protein
MIKHDDHWTQHINADPRIGRLLREIELARKHACLAVRNFGARGAADWAELEALEAKLRLLEEAKR